MADTTNVTFSAHYTTASAWSGTLEVTLTNNSGTTLNDPLEISLDFAKAVQPSTNTGLRIQGSGASTTHVVGLVDYSLLPIANGESVTFRIGIGSSSGGLSADLLPTAYYVNGVLAGEGGGSAPDTIAPSVPANVHVTNITQNSISLAWDPSTDNVGVDHYVVTYAGPNGVAQTVNVSSPTATITGLNPETYYSFSVKAVDAAGNESDGTAGVSATTSASSTGGGDTGGGDTGGGDTGGGDTGGGDTGGGDTGGGDTGGGDTGGGDTGGGDTGGGDTGGGDTGGGDTGGGNTGGGTGTTLYAPYTDVTLFAKWATTPPGLTTDFIKDAIALGVKKFHLAFLVKSWDAAGSPVWGSGSFPLETIAPIASMINAAGGEPVFAFGGASGVDFSTSWSVYDLAELYIKVANEYGVRTIDLDFETVGNYNVDVAYPAFIKAKETIPNLELCLTLPVFPTGLVAGGGLKVVQDAASYGLRPYVNIMAMDYGSSNTSGDMGKDAIQAVESTKNQLKTIWGYSDAEAYAKVGVTPMFGQNDVQGEVFDIGDAVELATFAKEKNIYMVSGWSLPRDFAPGTTDQNGNQHTRDLSTSTLIEGLEDYGFTKAIQNILNS